MQRHFSNRGEALPEVIAARMLARRKTATATRSWTPGKRLSPPTGHGVAESAQSKTDARNSHTQASYSEVVD